MKDRLGALWAEDQSEEGFKEYREGFGLSTGGKADAPNDLRNRNRKGSISISKKAIIEFTN